MNITRYALITLFFILAVAGRLASAAGTTDSMSDEQILQRFVLMNPEECRKPKIKPPPLPTTTFFEGDTTTTTNDIGSSYRDRFYLDLDGDGTCEILDVWIDRVTPDPDDYRLMGMSAIYKYHKKHWVHVYELPCRPKYQIFDRENKTIYYLVDFEGDLYKPVDGIYYLNGGLLNRGSSLHSGGIWLCSSDFVCKGVDFKHVAEVLMKQKASAEENKPEPKK